jgi:hypothetical protein
MTRFRKVWACAELYSAEGPLSGAWRKARWALLAAEDIAAFQAELSGQLEIVKMLAAMQLWYGACLLNKSLGLTW